MPTRRRLSISQIELILASLFTICTQCGRAISPVELRFAEGKIRRPQCWTLFEPKKAVPSVSA